jgi:hypothetical protein
MGVGRRCAPAWAWEAGKVRANNLEDDDFFAYEAEGTDAVIGQRAPETTQGGRFESPGFSLARGVRPVNA